MTVRWLETRPCTAARTHESEVPALRINKKIGVRGFEPPTPWSRTKCATRLRYTPKLIEFLLLAGIDINKRSEKYLFNIITARRMGNNTKNRKSL